LTRFTAARSGYPEAQQATRKDTPVRKLIAAAAIAALPFAVVACGDDDDDDIDIENPDLDPGAGTGLPGDGTIDLDPGEGTGLPGD
jgi:hypothetical protein